MHLQAGDDLLARISFEILRAQSHTSLQAMD